jgi:hypothetical protein
VRWKKIEKKKTKTTKEKEDKAAADYKERLDLQSKITKSNILIPQVVDHFCNFRKIPDDYRSTVKYRVRRNCNGRILRRCRDHGLTQDEERQFTPKPCDFDYTEKTIQQLEKKQNNIVLTDICHIDQVIVSTQMILQLKP